MFLITVDEMSAPQLREWFEQSGGVAVWNSINLSNPNQQWLTPLDAGRPNWQTSPEPDHKITEPDQIGVVQYEEYQRFHVAVRVGAQGLSLKLTDGACRRLWNALARAGEKATYVFDTSVQEVVILVPKDDPIPLALSTKDDVVH